MELKNANLVKDIIESKLNTLCDGLGIEKTFKLSIQESQCSKNHYGVHIATDGDVYEIVYEFGPQTDKNQELLINHINGLMGPKFTEEHHYFENEGYGVLCFY